MQSLSDPFGRNQLWDFCSMKSVAIEPIEGLHATLYLGFLATCRYMRLRQIDGGFVIEISRDEMEWITLVRSAHK